MCGVEMWCGYVHIPAFVCIVLSDVVIRQHKKCGSYQVLWWLLFKDYLHYDQ